MLAAGLALGPGPVATASAGAEAPGPARSPGGVHDASSRLDRPRVEIGWTDEAPTVDGRLEPDEWADAARIDGLAQALPDEGAAPTQHTIVYVLTDGRSLYVAARLEDTEPGRIVAAAMARDANTLLDDRFAFTIDPFLDRQNGYLFEVNPNGARRDALVEGGRVEASWDGRWYARASRDAGGWTVEIAVPFATLAFDPAGDVWGFNLERGLPRRQESDRWADPVRQRDLTAMGTAGDLVGLRGARQGLGLQVMPQATLRRVDDVDDPIGTNDRRHYSRIDPSLDVFYKPRPSLTTALTVNTDFGETEVDERVVNLSRFALFFPEKRDFFLQDALVFDFGDLAENGRPFFSRRIGLDADGRPRGITAGAKATGRVGRVKFGLLDVVLDERDEVPARNVAVARGAVNLGESTLGAIATHGDPEGRGESFLVGTDLVYRNNDFRDGQSLRGSAWIQASLNDPDTGPRGAGAVSGTGLAYGAALAWPNDRTNWRLAGLVFEDDFAPALGFTNRVGIRQYEADYRRRWRPAQLAWLQTIDSSVEGRLVTGLSSEVQTGRLSFAVVELRNPAQDGLRVQVQHQYERVETPFANFDVAMGEYHFDDVSLRLEASRNRPVGGRVQVLYGDFFDGTRTQVVSELALRFGRHVQTGIEYQLDDLRLPGGDATIQQLRARLSLLFTPDLSWVTLVQYDDVSDSIGVNSRVRWIIEDGRELFLVLNQAYDAAQGVRLVRSAPLVKLQWSFRF
ncbi:MAG: carbohydrate binding family 9 domain-containing protein [Spirochaetaceae bacterium]|nr:carbohydrate binding family 9 domain-containing protein [Spirochaetaceae bacterium]